MGAAENQRELSIEVLKERKNPLLFRLELDVLITYDGGTPKRDEVRKIIAEKYGGDAERVIIEKMLSLFGMNKARARVHIYERVEYLKLFESKHVLRRHGLLEEVKKGE